MLEKPILFNGEMVRAILDGRKTQTRRVVKPQRLVSHWGGNIVNRCPYGVPGNRLWVRETWAPHPEPENHQHAKLGYTYRADWDRFDDADLRDFRWKPSLHMPRSASRITLEITDVRVQRVQEIQPSDAISEGCGIDLGIELDLPIERRAQNQFFRIWDSINAKCGFGWEKNPHVWALTFRRLP